MIWPYICNDLAQHLPTRVIYHIIHPERPFYIYVKTKDKKQTLFDCFAWQSILKEFDMIHERKPNRLQGYDYSQDNLYFITSCVQDRVCCLGHIEKQKMVLNQYGEIAQKQWHWLGEQYPYIVLHAFVVMPNHIHGIIEINCANLWPGQDFVWPGQDFVGPGRDFVGPGRDLALQNQPKIKSLSELTGAYKTTASKKIHLLGFSGFHWQRSFHDHIIRDERSFYNISKYINNNPLNWGKDRLYNS